MASPKTRESRGLLLVLFLALLLRLWNITYPAWLSSDEQNIVDRALLLGQQGPNPRWFINPSLFLYVLFAADAAVYLAGRFLGAVASPEDFAAFHFANPLSLHVMARALTLVFGMGCLVVTYRIGRKWWGQGVGLAAAGALAVSPVYVLFSKLAKTDILMTLLLLIAAWATLRYVEEYRTTWLQIAGVFVGLAASAKYTAGLGVLWLVAAPWIIRGWRAALLEGLPSTALAGAAFLAGSPFALLDWPTFLAYFAEVSSYVTRGWYGTEDQRGYEFYLVYALPRSFGWTGTAIAVLGCGRWLLRGGPRERLLAGFAAAFYGWMGYSRHAAENFLLPALPVLALAGADLLHRVLRWVSAARPAWSRWTAGGIAAACLLPPLAHSVRETALLAARDTRELAGIWITQHLPPGTRIVSEPGGPFLPLSAGRLEEMIAEEERRRPGRGMRLRFQRARAGPGHGFWYYEMPLFSDAFLSRPAVEEYDLDRFLGQGYHVVILSSGVYSRYRRFPDRYPAQNAFFDRVSRNGSLVARFDPFTPWCCPDTLNARLSEAAARAWGRPGPTILVYRLANGADSGPQRQ